MLIAIRRLLDFAGPNIVSPNPGVLLDAYTDGDVRAGLRNALKDAGQQIGVVLGQLAITQQQLPPSEQFEPTLLPLTGESSSEYYHVRLSFATPTPALGAAIVRYAVAGLNAFARNDDEWDGEEQSWALQQRRRSEALPFAAIQVIAEAQRRNVPAFRRADGLLQFGYGARGASFEPAAFDQRSAESGQIPWQRLGRIPIIAHSGVGPYSEAWADDSGKRLGVTDADQTDFARARALLCQPDLEAAVVALSSESLLTDGLPFDTCDECVIGGLPEAVAPAFDRAELARAVALPLLATLPTGRATLAAEPLLRELAAYAPCAVRFVG